VFAVAGVIITLLGAAMGWSAYKSRAERADEVQTEAGTIATTAAALLNQYLASLDAMASAVARHPAVVSLDNADATRLFVALAKEQPLLGNILLRDADTRLRASAVPAQNPDAPAPSIVAQVIRTGRQQASQLVYGPITRRRTVFLAYPVKNDRGQVVGVLGFSVLLQNLETLFAKLPLPRGSVVVLADQNNVIMARSIESEKYLGSPIDVPKGPSPSFQLDEDGVQRFHGSAMIDRGPWLLSVAIPREEVLRRIAPLWQRNLLSLSIGILSVLGLALWIAWHTAIDLRRLQVAAGRIAAGDLSAPEPFAVPNREMADLQSSFVTMATKLRDARDSLDRQFAQERRMLEAVQSLQRQVVRQERLAAVGLLVSGIAHELNNPLQAILGTIEVIERQPDMPAEAIEDIAVVKAQSHRAREIIRNLSRFSKQKPGPPTLVDLRDVINSVVQLRKRELDSAGIALDIETASVRLVMASFAELEQVLLNFVVNAQQAIEGTGRKSGRILIRLGDAVKRVRLEVWDDGPGVPKDDEQKLFQPFFTTKPVGSGTGLGLSVSYGIVDAYDGATGYYNNEWGGATFFVELPSAGEAPGGQHIDDRAALLRGRVSSGV
jgi:C4-dicarboxylate-specific signal transduction histidine kinase